MIIGVALVVDEFHKGQRLVFRYPEAHPSFALFSGEVMMRFHEEYLALSPDNFARLFRPKPAFFNKILEITIGDINYISYPAPCLADSAAEGGITDGGTCASSHGSDTGSEEGDRSDGDNVITLFTVVVARVRDGRYQAPGGLEGGLSGVDPVSHLLGMSGLFCPVAADVLRNLVTTFARALLREQHRCGYVSREVKLIIGLQDAKNRDRGAGRAAVDLDDTTPSLHLKAPVAVRSLPALSAIDSHSSAATPSPSHRNPSATSELALDTVSAPGDLLQERAPTPLDGDSVGTDGASEEVTPRPHAAVSRLVAPPSTVSPAPVAGGSSAAGAKAPDGSAPVNMNTTASFSELIMLNSTLANEFRNLYHALIGGTYVNITVNRCLWITLPLQPRPQGPPAVPPSATRSTGDCASSAIDSPPGTLPLERAAMDRLKPFQTFLPVADEAGVLTIISTLQARSHDVPSAAKLDCGRELESVGLDSPIGRVIDDGEFEAAVDVTPPSAHASCGGGLAGAVSGHLETFLRSCDPTKSFAELAEIMEEPVTEIYAIANKLAHLGLGRVITCLSAASRFVLHPEAAVDVSSRAARAFYGVYGTALHCELYSVLQHFDGSSTLADISTKVDSLVAEYFIDIVIWLLRWNIILELKTFLFDAATAQIALSSEGVTPTITKSASSSLRDVSCPEERDRALRRSLSAYLDGRTTVTEILWNEPGLAADELFAFAERNDISVLYHYYEKSSDFI